MIASSGVSTSYKKKTLKLNVRQINSHTKTSDKPRKTTSTWKDVVVPGDFYGASLKKGCFRQQMEDAYAVTRGIAGLASADAFAVFDGHAGQRAALFAAEHLISSIQRCDAEGLRQAFLATDQAFCTQAASLGHKDGTTATVALTDGFNLYCGGVGDSRALLVNDYGQEVMSTEHLASDPSEKLRIEAAGGHVLLVGGVQRVQGTLVVSRSLGDRAFKDYLIPEPSLFYHAVESSDVALVLASDGLYSAMSDAEVASTVRALQHYPMHAIAEALAQRATDLGSRDNITVLVVDLRAVYSRACQVQKPMLFSQHSDDEDTTAQPLKTPKGKKGPNMFDF
jgi:serine/threonine protein phosphatase PrpC